MSDLHDWDGPDAVERLVKEPILSGSGILRPNRDEEHLWEGGMIVGDPDGLRFATNRRDANAGRPRSGVVGQTRSRE